MVSLGEGIGGLPPVAVAALVALIALQLALQLTAVVQLVRTPAARITLGGRKWLWALIIVLGEMVGPIVWFVAGRTAAPVQERPPASSIASDEAADALYGKRRGSE